MSYEFDSRLDHAATIPSSYYLDAAVLQDEYRSLFGRTWQLVGHAQKVAEPGSYFTAMVGNEPVLVVRGNDGELRAMSNVCRHRAGPVAYGEGKRPVLQCRYHGWTYGLDGALLTTPELEGIACFERADHSLPPFQVAVWSELVFVNLDPHAMSLTDFLGELIGDMATRDYRGFKLAARKEWELDCNWKVYVDNYLEGYHIPIVHPSLFREIDYPKYRTEEKGWYSIQHAPLRKPDRIRTENPGDEAKYFWLFPNLMLNVYPDNFSTNLIVPIGHERTLTVFEWYFRDPDGAKREIDDTVAFSDEIQLEDIEICEAVQRGLRSSTYTSGRYSPKRENGVHHFHGMYADAMGITRRT